MRYYFSTVCIDMSQGARCMRVTQHFLCFALRAITKNVMFKIVPDDFSQPLLFISAVELF
jgi:hypothetical protein